MVFSASKHTFLHKYAHPGSFFRCFYSEDLERLCDMFLLGGDELRRVSRVIFERSFSWVQMMLLGKATRPSQRLVM